MYATLFKEVSYSLAKLLEDIEMGEIGLPDIQRPFVWTNTKVRDLFDSMYKGFPVGYLLFWANALPNGKQIGASAKQRPPRLLIVDGQQRLTSLFAVLQGREIVRDDYRQERICIAFRPRDGKFEVADAATRRDPEFIPDISELWSGQATRTRFVKTFIEKLRAARDLTEDDEDHLSEQVDRLYDLRNYPFTALELSASVDEEQVADVFVRVNSKGTPLNQADFILTLMSVFWDDGRAELEHFCRLARLPADAGPSPHNRFVTPEPDQLLRVSIALAFRRARLQHAYNVLRGKDLQTGEFDEERRDVQFALLQQAQGYVLDLQHWHDFLKVLLRAGYRSKYMLTSTLTVLYTYALYLIGKRDFGVDEHRLRDAIARWFFMANLTGRYTGSPESVMEEDLARLREVRDADQFVAVLDEFVRNTITPDYWTTRLPMELETSSARSPLMFAHYAALNLLEARVLLSSLKMSELLEPDAQAKRAALEKHHLYPRGYLKKLGIVATRDVNQIANLAPIEWHDNAEVSDTGPAEYFPVLIAERCPDASERKQMHYWHALPEGWESMAYAEFLDARKVGIAIVIRDGFQKLW